MATIQERVQAGVDLLDQAIPGWDVRIDLTRLTIARGSDCICGQLFGTYGDGVHHLDLNVAGRPNTVELGFLADYGGSEYDALNAAWRELIAQRRLARVSLPAELLAV